MTNCSLPVSPHFHCRNVRACLHVPGLIKELQKGLHLQWSLCMLVSGEYYRMSLVRLLTQPVGERRCASTWFAVNSQRYDWTGSRQRGSKGDHSTIICHICSDSQTQENCRSLWSSPVGLIRFGNPFEFRPAAFTMDATIYQILFGEFGDSKCSLIDAFQDTFYENASFSLMNIDGR